MKVEVVTVGETVIKSWRTEVEDEEAIEIN